jgi:eukaryotic-like serine/threonine-protein kinase
MTTMSASRTLADRLTEGKIPVAEALRYALTLAESLRKIHDGGRIHGAVMPSNITLGPNGPELALAGDRAQGMTHYTAPEVVLGKVADARGDVFAFGAVLYEMLTGHRAFDGEGADLALSLANSTPPPSGSPLVDRVVSSCVAKNPELRWQRMQKVIMELKLLAVAARRVEGPAPVRAKAEPELREEIKRLESRMSVQMDAHEQTMSRMQQAASEAVSALRVQLASVTTQLAAAQEQLTRPASETQAVGDRIIARVESTVDSVGQRIAAVEKGLDELRRNSVTLQENVAADLLEFERTQKTQQTSIDSARTAMAQTDDLVERVVEALGLLQSTVLDQHDERTTTVN